MQWRWAEEAPAFSSPFFRPGRGQKRGTVVIAETSREKMFKKRARGRGSMTKAYLFYKLEVMNGHDKMDERVSAKTTRKKLTREVKMVDFSARQHGDGMKSPAAGGTRKRA